MSGVFFRHTVESIMAKRGFLELLRELHFDLGTIEEIIACFIR